jgi:hypothetical protein
VPCGAPKFTALMPDSTWYRYRVTYVGRVRAGRGKRGECEGGSGPGESLEKK